MTRRGVFSTVAGFIAGLFSIARARSWQNPEIKLIPGSTKDIRIYYLSFNRKNLGGHWGYSLPFCTDNKEIIKIMDDKLEIENFDDNFFGEVSIRIFSHEDVVKYRIPKDYKTFSPDVIPHFLK